ncbi:MAG: hypothetical protein KDJ98_08165 [Rhodobacteraceae bacterium]|nr:hypothetical protein [Paracoccaceae bacterium]
MPEQIALIEAPIREVTGEIGPRVVHEVCRFDVLGGICLVLESHAGDLMELRVGRRVYAISLVELAATAALAIEGHMRGEIRARVIASRATPHPGYEGTTAPMARAARDAAVAVPLRGTVGADGMIRPSGDR